MEATTTKAKARKAPTAPSGDWTALVNDIGDEAHLRRELSLRNPAYFDSRYCGMRWAAHRERWLRTLAEKFAESRASLRTPIPKKQKLLMLGPREHGKTEAVITFLTQAVCADRSLRILLVSEEAGAAKKRLGRIKDLLDDPGIVADWTTAPDEGYGPFRPERRQADERFKWSERMIYVLRDVSHVDATIEAVGAGGAITGGHFDLIVLDDPEDYETVLSPTKRAKRKLWLKATVIPMLNPGGLMVMIGTRKHHDDLYGMALADPTWDVMIDKAVIQMPAKADPIMDADEYGREVIRGWDVEGDHEVLWPAERPLEMLLEMRHTMGATNFAREMLNEVVDDDAVAFKRKHLDAATHRGRNLSLRTGPWPSTLLIVQAWDPAFVTDQRHAERTDSDYQVGVCWAGDVRTRDRYLLDLDRSRGRSHQEKADDVVRLWRTWSAPRDPVRCQECGWIGAGDPEDDICPLCDGDLDAAALTVVDHVVNGWAFMAAMEKNNGGQFMAVAAEQARDVSLFRHWTGKDVSDPYRGVPVLGAHYECGRVVLPYADHHTQQVIDIVTSEFHALGTSQHDDIPLAIWIAEMLLQRCFKLYDRFVERHDAPAFE